MENYDGKCFSIAILCVETLNNILVTGAAGFVGKHLVTRLALRKYKVVIVDVADAKIFGENIVAYKQDIRNTEAIQEIVKQEEVDTCVHLAAKVSVADSVINPNETIDVNIRGTVSVLEACARNGVGNFVFASSAAVYGNPLSLPVNENDTLKPLSPYGISKADGERIVMDYKIRGMIKKAVSLRFFNIYGEGQNPEYAGVITKFAERLSAGLAPTIYGNGSQTRDFISVQDVARAIILAAESEISGTFNVGTGKAISINELAERMTRIFGLDLKPIYLEAKKGDILHSCADMTNIRGCLGFETVDGLDAGLMHMFNEMLPKKSPANIGGISR